MRFKAVVGYGSLQTGWGGVVEWLEKTDLVSKEFNL